MHFSTWFPPAEAPSHGSSAPDPPGCIRRAGVVKLKEYRAALFAELSHESEAFRHFARLALTEAEALAWSTPYAHLFLPALAEEKIRYARQWASRQCRIAANPLPCRGTKREAM